MCIRTVILLIIIYCSLTSISYGIGLSKNEQPQSNITIDDNPANVDKILAQYNITKDDKYLIELLEYLNADEFMLVIAYENINRMFNCNIITQLKKLPENEKFTCYKKSYDELKAVVESKYPDDKEKMVKKMDTATKIFFELDQNRKNNKEFNETIRKIITNHPNLNYVKTIERIIFGKE